MKPWMQNSLAVIAGVVVGSGINMGLITVGHGVIPPPEGTDISTYEGLQAAMPLFEPKHFVFPFLAHALGTLAGALVATKVAASHQMRFALGIGALFMAGGISNIFLLPGPAWFNAVDVLLAYLPFAWLAGWLTTRGTGGD